MRVKIFIKLGILSLFIITSANANIKQGTEMKQDSTTTISAYFSLNDLAKERAEAGEPFIRFLNVPTMRMFIYSLPADGVDKQKPHKLDEVYYVTEGIAELSVEDKNYE